MTDMFIPGFLRIPLINASPNIIEGFDYPITQLCPRPKFTHIRPAPCDFMAHRPHTDPPLQIGVLVCAAMDFNAAQAPRSLWRWTGNQFRPSKVVSGLSQESKIDRIYSKPPTQSTLPLYPGHQEMSKTSSGHLRSLAGPASTPCRLHLRLEGNEVIPTSSIGRRPSATGIADRGRRRVGGAAHRRAQEHRAT